MANSNFDDPTPEQVAKLPKWAQQRIGRLENQLSRIEDEIEYLKSGSLVNAEEQKFFVDNYDSERFWLPQYGRLGFKQDPTKPGMAEFTVRKIDDNSRLPGIEVSSSANGRLAVVPKVSNVVQITTIEY